MDFLDIAVKALTLDAFARLVSVSRRTLQRRIKDGSIRAIYIGRSVRIPASELDRLVAMSVGPDTSLSD